jgi:histidyl-tRNA synthetase
MIPRERLLRTFRDVFGRYGFLPIETPHIERMEVLTGKGAGSDEVLRQIFEVTNKGGTPGELALRFDLTVPLARFIARHVEELGVPFKRYAIGSVFRGERPAKGRFREFAQCDFDSVGTESPLADAETASVIHDALSEAGVPSFTIALNNRKVLDGLLETLGLSDRSGAVLRAIDKRDKIGQDGVIRELTRDPEARVAKASPSEALPEDVTWKADPDLAAMGEATGRAPKSEKDEPASGAHLSQDQAETIAEFIESGRGGLEVLDRAEAELGGHERAAAGLSNLRQIVGLLDSAGVGRERIAIDLGLARGLDYYTGIVFETTVDGWERFGSVASGGRYDNLASLFTSRKLPGVGASIGLDRLIALLDEAGWLEKSSSTAPVLIARFPGVEPSVFVSLAARLRKAGVGCEVFPDAIPVGKQLGYGSSRGYRFGLIVGPDEVPKEEFNLRDLSTRKETKGLKWAELESVVSRALAPAPGS